MDQLPLTGRKALVIGAGTPVGRAIAVALAEAGADVAVAAATIDGEEVMAARRTKRAVAALGRRTAEYAFDTTLGQNVQVSTRQVTKELGGLDLLVNAQDGFVSAAAERMSDSEWGRSVALNLSGVFFACRAALREMSAGGGAILNVVQAPPHGGAAPGAAYAAAKAGVIGLSRALASELADRGIRVNAIEIAGHPDSGDELTAPPEAQAAALTVFLASPGCPLTGQVLRAGGFPLL
ncbi:MAG TPA: SDR family NAD(P)-dependent oxidoreductase [Dehalococcoidia bacterium]|nr:SDR family NAD(P)-dependent oxidoreductase [Dehalococcoidia bacterium]